MRTDAILCACLAAGLPGLAFAADPVPEQAFVARAAYQAAPPVEAAPIPRVEAIPSADDTAGDSAFDWWLAQTRQTTPFYQRWMDAVFNLIAPGEPYRRDKLVLVLGTSVGYDDNVLYSPTEKIGSSVFGVNGAADYHFGSRRLQLDANLGAGVNYYQRRPGGNSDQNFALALAAQYQLLPRLELTFNTHTSYLSQPSPQLIGGSFQYTGNYFYTDTEVGFSYQVRPRLSLVGSYDYNAIQYEDEAFNDGSGFYQQTFSLSGNWLVSPRTTFIVQYRYNPVNYYEAGTSSTGQILLVGFEQSLSPRLKYEFLFGAEHRALENADPDSPSSYLGPFAEGTLNYNFAPRSTLTGSLRLGTEPSGTSGVTIRRTFRMGLDATHFIGSRLSVNLGVSYEKDQYDQPGAVDYTQDIYSVSVALRYQFALYTSVVLRDSYLAVEGTLQNTSYTHNFTSLGLELTF